MSAGALPCCGPPDPCQTLLQEIMEFLANLIKREGDLRANVGNLPEHTPTTPHPRYGTRSLDGERHQFEGRQQGLRRRLTQYNDRGCGPPYPPHEAWRYAYMDVPQQDPRPAPPVVDPNAARTVATGAAAVGAGYVIYRIIRLIPSIFAPPTLIPNLAIP